MKYIERKDYNKVISVKLVVPGSCNARCEFCYMKDYRDIMEHNDDSFFNNYLSSLRNLIEKIDGKNPISLDITGNEPTLNVERLKRILCELKESGLKNKFCRVTMTTNGTNLKEIIPYLDGVVDYVNISVHDYSLENRQKIMGFKTFTQNEYRELINQLNNIGVTVSATAVIYRPINDFKQWFDSFVEWCENTGFISLRLRCDVFWKQNYLFDEYMEYGLNNKDYSVITHENTTDSHWCRLRKYNKFRVFFLKGVLDTSLLTKGIEYIIEDDGFCYCDYYKRTKIDDYKYEIGKIYDLVN